MNEQGLKILEEFNKNKKKELKTVQSWGRFLAVAYIISLVWLIALNLWLYLALIVGTTVYTSIFWLVVSDYDERRQDLGLSRPKSRYAYFRAKIESDG